MKKWLLVLLFMTIGAPALAAGRLAQVEIVDSATQRTLPIYYSQGRYYVAGAPGREYSIRLRNRTGSDLLAVVSVDGVNVVTGETAGIDQGGYILGRRQRFDVMGWRKSLDQVAAFYFSSVEASYAAQTGRPENVGVIGVALFKRKVEPPVYEDYRGRDDRGAASEPAAPGAGAAQKSEADERALGTGHGRRKSSVVRHGEFERESDTANEVVVIYYDSHANLVARGVIRDARPRPDPFPNGFVPDPPSG